MLNESSFDEIHKNYRSYIESVVDWKKKMFQEKQFFDFVLKKNKAKTLIDLKSGSGNYLFGLYGLYELGVGVDSDPSLVRAALEKCEDYPGIHVVDSTFNNLEKELKSKNLPLNYDCVLLMTNNVSTIINQDNLLNYLKSVFDLMSFNGVLISNSFNYNKFLKDEDHDFKKTNFNHQGSLYMLTRSMKIIDEDLVSYEANIYDASGHIAIEHRELQYPLTKKRFVELLEKAGFKEIEVYGDFSFGNFDVDNSRRMLIVAHKK